MLCAGAEGGGAEVKLARIVFLMGTVVFFSVAMIDAHINHRRSLYEGPWLELELFSAGLAIAMTLAISEEQRRRK